MKSPVGFPERSRYWKKLRSEAGALDSFFQCRRSAEANYRQDSGMSPWDKETLRILQNPWSSVFFLRKLCLPGPHLPFPPLFQFLFHGPLEVFICNLASHLPDLLRLSRPLTHSLTHADLSLLLLLQTPLPYPLKPLGLPLCSVRHREGSREFPLRSALQSSG